MTETKRSRTLIFLTLNEIEGVTAVLPTVPLSVADEVLAVDGGSTDGTVEQFKKHGVRIVSQKNRGRGDAFRVAAANTTGRHIVFFSPDGNEDPRDIEKLFQALEAGADMAIASRFLPDSKNEEDDETLPLRKWTNQGFTRIANTLWNRGPYITDTINGFRGLTRDTFEKVAPQSSGFTIEYEMSIRAMKLGLKVVEIPTVESPRVGGESKAPSLQTGIRFLKFLWSELFR